LDRIITVYLEELKGGSYGAVFCLDGELHKKIALDHKGGINLLHSEVMKLQHWGYDVKFTGGPLE